jgi:3-hydroxybutyryl-CoA dehydratase
LSKVKEIKRLRGGVVCHTAQASAPNDAEIGQKDHLWMETVFAEKTFFGQRIAHGMLSASLFSTMVGMHIPGFGAIYKSQTLEFLHPVYIGDTLCAWFEVVSIDAEAEEIVLKSWIENQANVIVIQGKTVASLLRGISD